VISAIASLPHGLLAPASVQGVLDAVGGVDLLTVAAVVLLVAGVVGSVVPAMPGPLLSVVGVVLYWWRSGYAEPHLLVLLGLVLTGVMAVLVDWLGGAVSARVGGASTAAMAAAAVAGFVLALVSGPVGLVLGIAGTVFVIEYYRDGDAEASVRTAGYATVGILASAVVQALLTGGMLVVMVVVIVF
jgi:hypothetical protein